VRWLIVVVAVLVGGCASFRQASDTVLIREPGLRTYGPPVDRSESAKAIWEYAVLSENAYFGAWKKQRRIPTPTQEARVFEPPPASQEAYDRLCAPKPGEPSAPESGESRVQRTTARASNS